MSGSLRLNGSTSGFSEITAPDVAGDQTFTLPAVGGNLSTVVYQQGTFTPVCDGVLKVTNAATEDWSTTDSVWARMGQMVFINFAVTWDGDGDYQFQDEKAWVRFSGYPYPTSGTFVGSWSSSAISAAGLGGVLSLGATQMYAYSCSANSNTNGNLRLTGQYITDDTTFVPINGATIS